MTPLFSRHLPKSAPVRTVAIIAVLLILGGGLALFARTLFVPDPETPVSRSPLSERMSADEINRAYLTALQTIVERTHTLEPAQLARELPELANEWKALTLTSAYKESHLNLYLILQKHADLASTTETSEWKASLLKEMNRVEKLFPNAFKPTHNESRPELF